MSIALRIPEPRVSQILSEVYGISGKIDFLPGEIDLNYKVEAPDGQIYVLKISRPGFDKDYFDFRDAILQHLKNSNETSNSPELVLTLNGNTYSEFQDDSGRTRRVRMLRWIEGRLWSKVNPKSDSLRLSLGECAGAITSQLSNFNHPYAQRKFPWDIAQSQWTERHLDLFSSEQREIIEYFHNLFEVQKESYIQLRKSVIHNDANDNNIIVSHDLRSSRVEAIIDFGDAIYTQTINDLAVCCAYAIMDFPDPLEAALPIISGYHQNFSLQEEELSHLYMLIAMRLVISVTKSAINKNEEPDNEYLLISEKSAWDLLYRWKKVSLDFAHYCFRHACGFTSHPNEHKFQNWAKSQKFEIQDIIPRAGTNEVLQLDLSVGSNFTGHEKEIADLELFDFKINRLQKEHPNKILAGGYCEPRVLYTSSAYEKHGNNGSEHRTVHVGIDFWYPAGTEIIALEDGVVVTATNDSGNKEYGGLVILKHQLEDFHFYSLYAHNTPESATAHKIGDEIKKSQKIAELGNYPENGNWVPHLHFQIMLSMLDYKLDFPGVVYANQLEIWKSFVPDPNLLFKNQDLIPPGLNRNDEIKEYRQQHLGKSLSLHYDRPLHIVRGSGQYLIDSFGRKYLDTVNNVAHVGHENYEVVKAGQQQMALLNTNTRYLHKTIVELTELLLETLPSELSVVHFVNSGSEANDLALRMAKEATGSEVVIASEIGYHGNTSATIHVSSYKFDGKGGKGSPDSTYVFPLTDSFRGKYRGGNTKDQYLKEVEEIIENIKSKNKQIGALILEPILSCGGQVELPPGFLRNLYQLIRNEGGVCISDEVQTGCGRVGKTFWGFELHGVIPDIVTIGKPFGNGHPVAAVVCNKKIADRFANGMEYFNTFGGNPVSCAIALEVLKTIRRENLQQQALEVGEYLKTQLKELACEFPILADIRGQGLFLGVELTDKELHPLPEQTKYLVERMKEHGILMNIDGKDGNVLKIKPPMVFSLQDADYLLLYIKKVLQEDFMNLKMIENEN